MKKRWIRWSLGGAALLLAAVAAVAVAGKLRADSQMARQVRVEVAPLALPADTAALERGRYLFMSRGCAECHGANAGGRDFINDGKGMHLAGPNITPGGVTAAYKPEDWVRTVRHGVKPDGRPVIIMPSEDYNRLTDADLGALVAYLRSVPPRQGGAAVIELPLPVQVLYGLGAIQDAAAKIDHSLPPPQPVPAAVDARHGAYVANMCIGCHGPGLSGGKIPGGPPDWPAAANLTPGEASAMARYPDAASFQAMLRSGKRPDGTPISVMPFESLAQLSDLDAQALHAYLKTLPARAAGGH